MVGLFRADSDTRMGSGGDINNTRPPFTRLHRPEQLDRVRSSRGHVVRPTEPVSVFDLLFLFAALATVASLVVGVVLAALGRRTAFFRLLRGLGVSVAGYLAIGLAVSFLKPQRVLSVGEPWCFDDWCLTVEHVATSPASAGLIYDADLRLSSRARRTAQRTRAAWVYLIDAQGHRFAPEAGGSTVPLDTLLEPGESIATSRSFHIPAGVQPLGLVTGHGGPYCGAMSFLVMGAGGCLFHKPPMVRIP
jgi:hypothetical protein